MSWRCEERGYKYNSNRSNMAYQYTNTLRLAVRRKRITKAEKINAKRERMPQRRRVITRDEPGKEGQACSIACSRTGCLRM
jgi:hypothetical protein